VFCNKMLSFSYLDGYDPLYLTGRCVASAPLGECQHSANRFNVKSSPFGSDEFGSIRFLPG